MVDLANTIHRDFNTDGIPASGLHRPLKSKIREWGTWVESMVGTLDAGDGVWKANKAALDGDLAHAAGTLGVVYNDSTGANNGYYIKSGGSGSGSWSQILTFLPGYQFVKATDAGAGTANAIVATSSPKVAYVDGVQLIRLNIFEANSSGTVTVAFDGGAALAVKTNAGNDPSVGGLLAGMQVLGVIDQSATVFRMVSDQASAAIVAQAEAAAATAVAAAAAVSARFVRVNLVDVSGASPSTAYEAGDTIDGVAVSAGDLILRATPGGNVSDGVYVASASGAASRSTLYDDYDDLPGSYFIAVEGTAYANTQWRCTSALGGTLGVTTVRIEQTVLDSADLLDNATIAASVGSNILTVALKTKAGTDPSPTDRVRVAFRSSTATNGGFVVREITSALSMTVSAGSKLGFYASQKGHIFVGLIDNAGTVEMCVSGAIDGLDESLVVSTTAEGGAGAADTRKVLYSTTARSNVALRRIGQIEITTSSTAGNWANAPAKLIPEPLAGLRPFFVSKLLRASRFGLKGDGSDEGALLQAFYDAAPNYIAEIHDGTFITGQTHFIRPYSRIYGAGMDQTILKIANSAAATVYGWFCTDETWMVPSHGVQLSDMTFDGNRANRTPPGSAALLYPWQCSDIVLENLKIINSIADGLYCGGQMFDPADVINSSGGVNFYGTAQGGTSTTITLQSDATTGVDGLLNTRYVGITDGAGRGQIREITAYNSTTEVCTVTPAWTIIPKSGDLYVIWTSNTRSGVAKRWHVKNVHIDNSYRNNLSIVGADHCTFENCSFTRANGASPECGVDFEPDARCDVNTDIMMINCRADENDAAGFVEGSPYNYRCNLVACSGSGNGTYGRNTTNIGQTLFGGRSNVTALNN